MANQPAGLLQQRQFFCRRKQHMGGGQLIIRHHLLQAVYQHRSGGTLPQQAGAGNRGEGRGQQQLG
jgi:hypothetical protein